MNTEIIATQPDTIQAEIAFAIKSFNKLPSSKRVEILEGLRSSDRKVREAIFVKFAPLLTGDENGRVLTKFVNEFIGEPGLFDIYCISTMPAKCVLTGMHFICNLPIHDTDLLEEFTKPL